MNLFLTPFILIPFFSLFNKGSPTHLYSRGIATPTPFSYELLIFSYEIRLYLHPFRMAPISTRLSVLYSLPCKHVVSIVVERYNYFKKLYWFEICFQLFPLFIFFTQSYPTFNCLAISFRLNFPSSIN